MFQSTLLGGCPMGNDTRIGVQKVAGWIMLACGIFVMIDEFWGSEHTLRDFRNALKEGLFLFMLGAYVLAQAGFAKRIHQLENENAALRAAKSEAGSTQGKAQP